MAIKGSKLHKWTDEQKEWIKNQFNPFKYKSDMELCDAFNRKFNCNISVRAIDGIKQRLKLKSQTLGQASRKYTKEQDEWLINNAKNYKDRYAITTAFNAQYGTNLTYSKISERCDCLHARCERYFSKEQLSFLEENISKYSYDELTKLFNKKFGTNETINRIKTSCYNRRLILGNKRNEMRSGNTSKCYKPIGTMVVRNRENGLKRYLVKVTDTIGEETRNWVSVPKEIAYNNELVNNCAMSYAQIKMCEKKLGEK